MPTVSGAIIQVTGRREQIYSVRFNDENNATVEFENEALLHSNCVWYQAEEYVDMKARSRSEAREARKQGVGVLLACTFESPGSDAQTRINAFVRLDEQECQRGLERFLSREHGDERVDSKDRARSSVMIHQQRLKGDDVRADDIAQALATIYQEATLNATIFARWFGIADELVVNEGEDSAAAEYFISSHYRQKERQSKVERRLSNSNYSVQSQASMDSRQRLPLRRQGKHRPLSSPSSATEEFYAAIA